MYIYIGTAAPRVGIVSTYIYRYMYIHICVCMCIYNIQRCMCLYIYIYIVCIYVYTHVYMNKQGHSRKHVSTHVYMYIHIYLHADLETYSVHAQKPSVTFSTLRHRDLRGVVASYRRVKWELAAGFQGIYRGQGLSKRR